MSLMAWILIENLDILRFSRKFLNQNGAQCPYGPHGPTNLSDSKPSMIYRQSKLHILYHNHYRNTLYNSCIFQLPVYYECYFFFVCLVLQKFHIWFHLKLSLNLVQMFPNQKALNIETMNSLILIAPSLLPLVAIPILFPSCCAYSSWLSMFFRWFDSERD